MNQQITHKKEKDPRKSMFYVQGMHCASCEVLIEKTLIQRKGIKSVDVSLKDMRLVIWHEQDLHVSSESLNEIFMDLKYTFSRNKQSQYTAWNRKKMLMVAGTVLSLFVLYTISESLQVGKYISVDATSSLVAFFVLGVAAGASSCAALVGGLLLSMTKVWNERHITESAVNKSQPHILFHTGRIISYVIFGGILGALGNAVTFDNITAYAVLIVLISCIMIILGMQMLGVRWAQKFRFALPKSISRYISAESHVSGFWAPFVLGAGTFFLPCGFTLVAQGVALVSGSFFAGSLIMGLFALGTLPTLLLISVSGLWFNRKPHWTARFNIMAGIVVLFFGMYNVNAQLNVLGLPSLSRTATVQSDGEISNEKEEQHNKVQTLRVIARDFEYVPLGSMILKADEPTQLLVENQGVLGCGQYMAARGLFDGWIDLKPGSNSIQFTPKKGTYKLTCTMGMVPPIIITVN